MCIQFIKLRCLHGLTLKEQSFQDVWWFFSMGSAMLPVAERNLHNHLHNHTTTM